MLNLSYSCLTPIRQMQKFTQDRNLNDQQAFSWERIIPCELWVAGPEMSLAVPPPDPTILPPVSMADFAPYLRACGTAQQRFKAARAATADAEAKSPLSAHSSPHVRVPDARISPGEGLLEAMRAVPSMFFEEGFTLARCPPIPPHPLTTTHSKAPNDYQSKSHAIPLLDMVSYTITFCVK